MKNCPQCNGTGEIIIVGNYKQACPCRIKDEPVKFPEMKPGFLLGGQLCPECGNAMKPSRSHVVPCRIGINQQVCVTVVHVTYQCIPCDFEGEK